MYLWLIIATFIAALAAMGTSLRPDMKSLYVEPQAQNVITKIYTQHRAAMKFVQARIADDNGLPTFQPGTISADDLRGYLPYGFRADSGTSHFTTNVYCLDKNSQGHSAVPAECSTGPDPDNPIAPAVANCCAATGRIAYLVTFGQVPSKWQDIRTGKPSGVLLDAMKDTLGYINGFGYVVNKNRDNPEMGDNNKFDTLHTNYGILGQGTHFYYSIPTFIENDGGFRDCRDNYCLIYITTF